MVVLRKETVCGLILASAISLASPALAEDPSSNGGCNIYFKMVNQTGEQIDGRVLKRRNADNVDMPDIPPNSSDTTSCFWLENSNRSSSVEVSYAGNASSYFVINYVAEYKNDEITQDAIVNRDSGSDIDATYDTSSMTVTITEAD